MGQSIGFQIRRMMDRFFQGLLWIGFLQELGFRLVLLKGYFSSVFIGIGRLVLRISACVCKMLRIYNAA
jgi:hypothetical protein